MLSSSETFGLHARTGADTLSRRSFIFMMSAYIAGGLALAASIASSTYYATVTWWWVLGYFAVAIPGILISASSDNWALSSIGYTMVVAATGAILGPSVRPYAPELVMNAVLLTGGATLGIGLAGALYPKSVENWGGFLLMALIMLLLARFAEVILLSFGFPAAPVGLLDYAGALIFSAYIFYDMNRAMRIPATMDNAVDTAVALYLDIINLFLHLLAILGNSRD